MNKRRTHSSKGKRIGWLCERFDGIKKVEVNKITLLRGEGTEEDPCRLIFQYWTLEGEFLFEIDSTVDYYSS